MSQPDIVSDGPVDEFLNGTPRAETWRELREALTGRLRYASENYDAVKIDQPDDPRLPELKKRLDELKNQVAVLAEEEAVARFVEDSVRASLYRPTPGLLSIADYDSDEDLA